ncbi:MAG: sensor domain-containing diguanylate cyclase [Gammaproteobacteria bacterium]
MHSTDKLRKTLRAYVSNAQHNEEKLQRFNRQELEFITSIGLQDLIEVIHNNYRQNFRLDHVSLLLVDEDHEIRHILRSLQLQAELFSISFSETPIDPSLFSQGELPILGSFNNDAIRSFFNNNKETFGSAAILPLKRGEQLIGTLNIASKDANRFITGAATDFLNRLACILAVCIENAINHEKIKLLGLIDPLTGIHNRRYFEQRLNEEIDNSLRQNDNLGLMIIDLDFFKAINDNCGHLTGDLVLQEVSSLIRRQLRLSDVLARYGGEEFVVIISKSDARTVYEVAERIRISLPEHAEFNKLNLPQPVSASIGLCMLPQNPIASSVNSITKHLLKRADEALYKSKQQGRNQTTVINY